MPAFEAPPVAVMEIEEVEPDLEPVPMATRVGTAVRIGSWVGAALGIVGFLVATMTWAPAAVIPAEGAAVAVEVSPDTVLIAIAAVSVVFGAIVASFSRAATSWRDPAMELSGRRSTTAWLGAGLGLVLGLAAGGVLTGALATPVGEDGAFVHLPVLGTVIVMVIGGAVLGALTAALPQLLGTPVAVAEEEAAEVEDVRKRLGATLSVPLTGFLLLLFLVLPFAYILIQSNHLTANGAAAVAVITAGGILGFAALSGNRPHVRITFGELMVAVIGIGTVLLLVIAVLVFRDNGQHEEAGTTETAAVVSVL
jgi:MFS family permease